MNILPMIAAAVFAFSGTSGPQEQPAPGPEAAQPESPQPEAPQPAEPGQAQDSDRQPATAADLIAGATVRGPDGSVVGTIVDPDAEGASVTTGTARARLPLSNFQKAADGLINVVNRAQFEAAVGGGAS